MHEEDLSAHTCGSFVLYFGSGCKKRSCDFRLVCYTGSISSYVSSQMSTVFVVMSDSTAF